jgi:hypothetical protein
VREPARPRQHNAKSWRPKLQPDAGFVVCELAQKSAQKEQPDYVKVHKRSQTGDLYILSIIESSKKTLKMCIPIHIVESLYKKKCMPEV